jgi:hypothetical protein
MGLGRILLVLALVAAMSAPADAAGPLSPPEPGGPGERTGPHGLIDELCRIVGCVGPRELPER